MSRVFIVVFLVCVDWSSLCCQSGTALPTARKTVQQLCTTGWTTAFQGNVGRGHAKTSCATHFSKFKLQTGGNARRSLRAGTPIFQGRSNRSKITGVFLVFFKGLDVKCRHQKTWDRLMFGFKVCPRRPAELCRVSIYDLLQEVKLLKAQFQCQFNLLWHQLVFHGRDKPNQEQTETNS